MSLPMGEDWSVPLVMEVLSLFSPYSLFIPSCISLLVLLCTAIHSFITAFHFTQALQKIRLANHICSLVELLHTDVIQQLEVALLGSLAAKLLDVLLMSMQHQTAPLQSTTVPPCPLATSSISPSLPSVAIMGAMDKAGLADARATLSEIPAPKPSTETEAMPSKCQHIIPMPISPTTSRSSSLLSQLPILVVPKLVIPAYALPEQINCPRGCKNYKCQLCAFQHTNRDCMLMHIQQHLDISIRCPMCRKGFQNVASLCKHGKKVHTIHIMVAEDE